MGDLNRGLSGTAPGPDGTASHHEHDNPATVEKIENGNERPKYRATGLLDITWQMTSPDGRKHHMEPNRDMLELQAETEHPCEKIVDELGRLSTFKCKK